MSRATAIPLRVPQDLRDEIERRVRRSCDHAASDAREDAIERDPDHEYGYAQALRGGLYRYYEICRRHPPTAWLSRAEISVVCDAINGGLLWVAGESGTLHVRSIWHEVADAIDLSSESRTGLPDEIGSILARHRREGEPAIDGADLVRSLQQATYADLCALADFVERFWAHDASADRVVYPDRRVEASEAT